MGSPFKHYLNTLSKWHTTVALAEQWYVVFDLDSVGALKDTLNNELSNFEGKPWGIMSAHLDILKDADNQNTSSSFMGCVFARQVTLPGEVANISHKGLSYGGYMSPLISENRNTYSPLNMMFMETNVSFCDYIIRPWIALASYYGMIARPTDSPKNVKCPLVQIYQFAKDGPNKEARLRKEVSFYNVVPTSLDSKQMSYLNSSFQERSVSFAYDSYSVASPSVGPVEMSHSEDILFRSQ